MKKSAFTFLFTLTAGSVLACTCPPGMSPEDRISSSEQIYLGKVSAITPIADEQIDGQYEEYQVDIKVVEIWKGDTVSEIQATMDYYNPSILSSCSAPIPLGFHGFLVLLTSERRPALTSCTHNVWLIDETEIDETRELVESKMKSLK